MTSRKLIRFYLDGRIYGMDIAPVREILLADETQVFKIPNSPPFLAGMINLRGTLAPLLDMRVKLGFQSSSISDKSRIIMVKARTGGMLGALVDELGDIVERVEGAPAQSGSGAGPAEELVKTAGEDGQEMRIIDFDREVMDETLI